MDCVFWRGKAEVCFGERIAFLKTLYKHHAMLTDHRTFLVKEHAHVFKLSDTYDILEPETQNRIGIAKEEVSGLKKLLRFLINKSLMSTTVSIYEDESQPAVFSIYRGPTFLRAKVEVLGPGGEMLGFFKSKIFSVGGAFTVHNAAGEEVAVVQGSWTGWNFKFTSKNGLALGEVTKKWGGFGKEFFTSADSYIIALSPDAPSQAAILLIAAGLAVDIVFKERK